MTITPLTSETLRAQAREAALQHVPLDEANHHEPGTDLWREFNGEYLRACRIRDRESDALEGFYRQSRREFFFI